MLKFKSKYTLVHIYLFFCNNYYNFFHFRNISVNLRHNLVEVKHANREAVFENLDTQEKITVPVR